MTHELENECIAKKKRKEFFGMTYEGYSRLTNQNAHMHESERVHNFHVRMFRFFRRLVFYFIDSSECNDVMLRIPVFFFSGGFPN